MTAKTKDELLARERERSVAKRIAPPHADFAARINKAVDLHPTAPPLQYGRLPWMARELDTRFGIKASVEGVRKWFAGLTYPRQTTIQALAEMFEVDESWLATGQNVALPSRQRKVRNAEADGAVNLVAGIIQMDGGAPAFPQVGSNPHIDLYAIIRGAQYSIHVATGMRTEAGVQFNFPTGLSDALVIGVVRKDGFAFDLVEIPGGNLAAARRGADATTVDAVVRKGRYYVGDEELKRVKGFSQRL